MKHKAVKKAGAEEVSPIFIYGKHVVVEALTHMPAAVRRVFLDPSLHDETVLRALQRANVPMERLSAKVPKGLDPKAVHQGVVADISRAALMVPYKEFINSLSVTSDTCLLMLGELEDPQNVGAVIRSAAAFGVAGVLIPPHNQVQVTGAVIKVSAGMAFRIPIVSITNVNTTARDLKDRGFWVYGLAGDGEQSLVDEQFEKPSAFILGNEADGLRAKTREACDILLTIPIHARCESLNAGAAAAAALFAWSAKHPGALAGGRQ